jgi:hypothetical protein
VEKTTATVALKDQKNQRNEAVYLVMTDPDMIRLILAWQVYGSVEPKKPNLSTATEFNAMVAQAWDGCQPIDIERLANLAELSRGTASIKTEILLRQGLIYPDGTANEQALVVIRAQVRAGLLKATT